MSIRQQIINGTSYICAIGNQGDDTSKCHIATLSSMRAAAGRAGYRFCGPQLQHANTAYRVIEHHSSTVASYVECLTAGVVVCGHGAVRAAPPHDNKTAVALRWSTL